mmetsp:Transcript_4438/g.17463  ORF Transcript_4438/g.17463 Transcript_4438/m.17463 type:complete len:214 (+) Transcript_4438:1297-1938(+)
MKSSPPDWEIAEMTEEPTDTTARRAIQNRQSLLNRFQLGTFTFPFGFSFLVDFFEKLSTLFAACCPNPATLRDARRVCRSSSDISSSPRGRVGVVTLGFSSTAASSVEIFFHSLSQSMLLSSRRSPIWFIIRELLRLCTPPWFPGLTIANASNWTAPRNARRPQRASRARRTIASQDAKGVSGQRKASRRPERFTRPGKRRGIFMLRMNFSFD